VAALVLLVLTAAPSPAAPQQARGFVGSTVQFVGLRPFALGTEGCGAEPVCYRTGSREVAAMASQDVGLTAWGLGVRGLSATVLVRARQRLGGDFLWPRTDDPVDALLAYAELARGAFTVRAGRQELRSGLGFPSFDGASLGWSGRAFRVEGYGGRSLARGLREPADEALRGLEDFLPDQGVYLLGAAAHARPGRASLTARYHREILRDRSGLASERASLDVSTAWSRATVRGALDYDLGRGMFGKGELTVGVPFDGARWLVEASVLRYVPYFSLSTIWGLFEPVSYTEARMGIGWAPFPSLTTRASAGVRRYGDAGTVVVLRPLEDTGRRASVDVDWRFRAGWSLGAGYDLEWGPGGFLSSGEGAVRWAPSERLRLTVSGRTFQQIEQYRLGDGRAVGGGFSAAFDLTERIGLSGGGSILRRSGGEAGEGDPWHQSRAWSAVRLRIGRDPGVARLGARAGEGDR